MYSWTGLISYRPKRSRKGFPKSAPYDISNCEPPSPTTLARLPAELILLITECLQYPDLACFSLCDRRIYELSRRLLKKLCDKGENKLSSVLVISRRLERDTPELYTCNICNILHYYDESECSSLCKSGQTRYCRPQHAQERDAATHKLLIMRAHGLFTPIPNFYFVQVKLAVRRFHFGNKAGISTDSLAYTQVRQYPLWWKSPGIISLFSREAQVCPSHPSFHLRLQDVILVKKWSDLLDEEGRKGSCLESFEVCRHANLMSFFASRVYQGLSKEFTVTGGCYRCSTEYVIEVGKLDSTPAITMTRWIHLGCGLIPEDPLWNKHTWQPLCGIHQTNIMENACPGRSPRLCYEQRAPQSFKDLRSRNRYYLRNQRYKYEEPFREAGPSFWEIPCGELGKHPKKNPVAIQPRRISPFRDWVANKDRPTV